MMNFKLCVILFLTILSANEILAGDSTKSGQGKSDATIDNAIECVREKDGDGIGCYDINDLLKNDIEFKKEYSNFWKSLGFKVNNVLDLYEQFKIVSICNDEYIYIDTWCKYDQCYNKYKINKAYLLYRIRDKKIIGIVKNIDNNIAISEGISEIENNYLRELYNKNGYTKSISPNKYVCQSDVQASLEEKLLHALEYQKSNVPLNAGTYDSKNKNIVVFPAKVNDEGKICRNYKIINSKNGTVSTSGTACRSDKLDWYSVDDE